MLSDGIRGERTRRAAHTPCSYLYKADRFKEIPTKELRDNDRAADPPQVPVKEKRVLSLPG
jgi:hypothetical protein